MRSAAPACELSTVGSPKMVRLNRLPKFIETLAVVG
jgi:hypothetical protein